MNSLLRVAHSIKDFDIRKDYRKNVKPILSPVPTNYNCPNISKMRADLWDTDWLFAALAMAESYILAKGWKTVADNDLPQSAYHMLGAIYEIDGIQHPNLWGLTPNEFGYFGNRQYALTYLTRGDGTVAILSDPDVQQVTSRSRSVTDSKPCRYLVTNVRFIENPFTFPNPLHQFDLKQNIQEYGPASVKMYYDLAYLKQSGSEWCYYCPDPQTEPSPELQEIIYHSVMVIGWDDNFDKCKFAKIPADNGAFKVTDGNSAQRGGSETFWVSYEDVEFGRDTFLIREMRKDFFEKVRTIYQHDLFGCGTGYPRGIALSTQISGCSIFNRDPSKTEKLEAVSWYLLSPANCNVYLKQGTKSEQKLNTNPLTIPECGYYTFSLPTPVNLTEDTFSIRVEFKSINGTTPVFVPLEQMDKRTVHLKLVKGECMIDSRDVTDVNKAESLQLGHVCIKAMVADQSADALKLNIAYGTAAFSTGNKGVSGRLQDTDANNVVFNWNSLENGSEGDLSLFKSYAVQNGSVWVNNASKARRIVLTLQLSLGGYKLRKLIQTTIQPYSNHTFTLGSIPQNQVYCTVSGTFPADGVRVKLCSTNKNDPADIRYLDPTDYPVVSGGRWTVNDFALLNASNYNPTKNVYIVSAEYLSSTDEVIARGIATEVTVPSPIKKNNEGSWVATTLAGLMAMFGGFVEWAFGSCSGKITATGTAAAAAGMAGGGISGTINQGQTFSGINLNITTKHNGVRYRRMNKVSGTFENTDISTSLMSDDSLLDKQAANDLPCLSFIETISSTGIIRNCSFEVIVEPGFNPDNCIVAIAQQNEGLIENCTVTIRSGSRVKQLAGIALNNQGTIKGCKIQGTILAETACGIVLTNTGQIEDCTVECDLTGSAVSGVCGGMSSGTVKNTVFKGKASGTTCGGIVGSLAGGTVLQCLFNGTIDGTTSNCGGIAAEVTGSTLTDCYSLGTVTGNGQIGGIAGNVTAAGTVQRCYSVTPLNGSGGIASGIAGTSADGRIIDCVAVNPGISSGEIYRTTKSRPASSCIAMDEIQVTAGQSFPDTGEQVKPIGELCKPAIFQNLGWDLNGVWNMDDNNQFPLLRGTKENPDVRHPYITIDRQPVNGRYVFNRNDTVAFSGMKNSLVTKVSWSLEDSILQEANSGNDNQWEVTIGKLLPGEWTITLIITAQNNVEFKLPITVS